MHDLPRVMPGLWHARPHAGPGPAAGLGPGLGPDAPAPAPATGLRELRRQSTADQIRNAADDEAQGGERGGGAASPLARERGVLVPAQE